MNDHILRTKQQWCPEQWCCQVALVSCFGLVSILCVWLLVVVQITQGEVIKPTALPSRGWQDVALASGTFMYAYGGHAIFPSIQASMRQPELFPTAISAAFAVMVLPETLTLRLTHPQTVTLPLGSLPSPPLGSNLYHCGGSIYGDPVPRPVQCVEPAAKGCLALALALALTLMQQHQLPKGASP